MLSHREGKAVPQARFTFLQDGAIKHVSAEEVFKGKTVVVFSLPGAFTPTCSSAHVPRFNELAPAFKQNGVDEIVCVSVNDAFVMDAWSRDQQADRIRFLADGNGEFTAGMDMLVDKSDLGFGKRSWRYAMLVKDGVIVKQFIEPNVPGDPFEVSDADTVLRAINPQAEKPHAVTVFTKPGCPYCARAKALLQQHAMAFEEIVINGPAGMRSVRAVTGKDTVPQVYVDGERIGGSDALAQFLENRKRRAV